MAEETIDPVDQTAPGDSVEQPELEQIVDQPEAEKSDDEMDAESHRIEADFALQLVDTLIKFNNEEFSSIEIPNRFTGREEMSCFALFAQAAPITPILASYPEGGFLFFKGVSVPKSANLTSTGLSEIEQVLRSNYSVSFGDLNLADLEPVMINSYQMAAKIYNDRVDKMRVSYSANVKNAKAQVVEVSVAALCGFAVILILASLF
jgi:hypothetical protein